MSDVSQIRLARERKGLSQEALGDKLGVTKASVSRWENAIDLPSPDKAKQLSQLLGISLEKIYEAA